MSESNADRFSAFWRRAHEDGEQLIADVRKNGLIYEMTSRTVFWVRFAADRFVDGLTDGNALYKECSAEAEQAASPTDTTKDN